jgi:hypothetical protein
VRGGKQILDDFAFSDFHRFDIWKFHPQLVGVLSHYSLPLPNSIFHRPAGNSNHG